MQRFIHKAATMFSYKRTAKEKLLLGALLALYLYALPNAIEPFNLLLGWFGLSTLKIIPLILIFFVSLVFLKQTSSLSIRKDQFLSSLAFVLVVFSVFLIESNPVKYLHIPEYILLFGMTYLIIVEPKHEALTVISAIVCSSLLGIVDELHQGVHPLRYFGWKDMTINCAGSFIGALILIRSKGSAESRIEWASGIVYFKVLPSAVLTISLLVTLVSISTMLSVAAKQISYPIFLLFLNGWVLFSCLCVIAWAKMRVEHAAAIRLIYLWPSVCFAGAHLLLILIIRGKYAFI